MSKHNPRPIAATDASMDAMVAVTNTRPILNYGLELQLRCIMTISERQAKA